MGVSTNAQISWGFLVEDESELPWQDAGEDDWWLKVNGYEPPFELFTEEGSYIGGQEPPKDKINEYFAHRREFLKARPLPFESVNACHIDEPVWILAVPGTVQTVYRGHPEPFEPTGLVTHDLAVAALREFCAKHSLPINTEGKWWLSSYWG